MALSLRTPYVHTDGRTLRLGKGPAVVPATAPRFHNYLKAAMPPPLPAVDWYKGVTSWGMMLNDTLSDCCWASKGHDIQVVSLNTTGEVTLPDSVIEDYYEWWGGYIPGDPSTDNGGIISQVLNSWHRHGMWGYKLPAYAYVDPTNQDHILKAIGLLGSVDIGLNLPNTAQNQVGGVWDVVGNPATDPDSMPNSWGGHDVNMGKYKTQPDGSIMYEPITWGENQQMTSRFLLAYCDEIWALLQGMFFNPDGLTASGFDWQQMIADMQQVEN